MQPQQQPRPKTSAGVWILVVFFVGPVALCLLCGVIAMIGGQIQGATGH
jgi:hypothetical protein